MDREHLLYELQLYFQQTSKKYRLDLNQLFGNEMSFADFLFLRYINENGPIKPSDIAAFFRYSLSHVTSLANRMINKGLIERYRSEEDRRSIKLVVNENGQKVLEQLMVIRKNYTEMMYKNLTDDEIKQMIRLYKKVNHLDLTHNDFTALESI